jgi:hypothetical protein
MKESSETIWKICEDCWWCSNDNHYEP